MTRNQKRGKQRKTSRRLIRLSIFLLL